MCVCVCSLDELFSIIFGVLIIRILAPSPFSSELAVYIVHLFLDIHDSNEYRRRLSLSIGQNCLERLTESNIQRDSWTPCFFRLVIKRVLFCYYMYIPTYVVSVDIIHCFTVILLYSSPSFFFFFCFLSEVSNPGLVVITHTTDSSTWYLETSVIIIIISMRGLFSSIFINLIADFVYTCVINNYY